MDSVGGGGGAGGGEGGYGALLLMVGTPTCDAAERYGDVREGVLGYWFVVGRGAAVEGAAPMAMKRCRML